VCLCLCLSVYLTEEREVSSLSLSVQSLDWETFEQYCAWQLFLAHNIPLETIIPILQHLKYKGK
jgi:integrator complex subunit 3